MPCEGVLSICPLREEPTLQPGAPGSPGPAHRRLSVLQPPTGEPKERDPVCGMTVSATAPERASFEGRTYFFCCAGCRERFEKEPGAYLSDGPRGGMPGAASVRGWCATASGKAGCLAHAMRWLPD